MRQSLLVLIMTASALRADSFTSVSCSLGSETITSGSSCSIPFTVGVGPEPVSGFVAADAIISGEGSSNTSAEADGGATAGTDVSWSAGGTESDTEFFATAGPVRPGLIGVLTDGFGGSNSANLIENGFGYAGDQCCLPFELGMVFQVSVYASAAAGGGPGEADAEDSSAGVTFVLSEADGTSVAFFSVGPPEPATWGLLLVGFSAYAMLHARAPKAG
jgi:hypothetical protein